MGPHTFGACVVSALGGAGRSFFAWQLAHGLADATAAEVGLIDITSSGTCVDLSRTAKPVSNMVATWQIDPAMVSTSGTLERVSAVMGPLGAKGAPVVVEVPAGCGALATHCVERAAVVFVLTDCSVAGLVGTVQLLQKFTRSQADQRLRIVVNRTQRSFFGALTFRHAERHLGRRIALDVPFDPAIQVGELDVRRLGAPVTRAIETMVAEVRRTLGGDEVPAVQRLSA